MQDAERKMEFFSETASDIALIVARNAHNEAVRRLGWIVRNPVIVGADPGLCGHEIGLAGQERYWRLTDQDRADLATIGADHGRDASGVVCLGDRTIGLIVYAANGYYGRHAVTIPDYRA